MTEDGLRDYAAEMRAIMDRERTAPFYTITEARDRIVKDLRANDRELWLGWLDIAGPSMVWEVLDKIDRDIRRVTKAQAERHRFAEAADDHERGDSSALLEFMDMPIRIGAGMMPLGKLHAAELLAAKSGYDQRAQAERMMGAFLGALLKKVGSSAVGEVFSEQQLVRMWKSLTVSV